MKATKKGSRRQGDSSFSIAKVEEAKDSEFAIIRDIRLIRRIVRGSKVHPSLLLFPFLPYLVLLHSAIPTLIHSTMHVRI